MRALQVTWSIPLETNLDSYLPALRAKPVAKEAAVLATEMGSELAAMSQQKNIQVISAHRLLQQSHRGMEKGILLGPTGLHRAAIEALARRTRLVPWWSAYEQRGIELDPRNTYRFMRRLRQDQTPLVYLVPPGFRTQHITSTSWIEFQFLREHAATMKQPIKFVLGYYDMVGIDFYESTTTQVSPAYSRNHLDLLLKSLAEKMDGLRSGIDW
jgi:hypothetical protein